MLPTLDVMGVIDDFDEPGDPGDPLKPPFRSRTIHLDRLLDLFLKPDTYLADTFGWGQPGFDGTLLFPRIKRLLEPVRAFRDADRSPGAAADSRTLFHAVQRQSGDKSAEPHAAAPFSRDP